MKFIFRFLFVPILLIMAFALTRRAAVTAVSPALAWQQKVDEPVLQAAASGPTPFLVYLDAQADLSGATRLATKEEKGAYVYRQLTAVAARSQPAIITRLERQNVPHQPFWIANMIRVEGDLALVQDLARRADVARIYADTPIRFEQPEKGQPATGPEAIEWGVLKINADDVWNMGYTGNGIVVAGQDTGYAWAHAALQQQYRGWDGVTADHNYNWHDAIHSGGGSCGPDSPVPCDDHGHGTHTMGTMIGYDGGSNQIGVAPGATWIGCRNMNVGVGTPATYSECFQWFVAPTDSAGQNPDPAMAPHVINNSWTCPASEGCTTPDILRAVVENARAAGIVVVVSAGNSGSACSTVYSPASIYEASFTIGATSSADVIASFSSRGPVLVDGSGRLKPDVSAPGVTVRSSLRSGGYGTMSGTSMAAPHVAGAVALLLDAQPGLAGQVDAVEALLTATAVPLTTGQNCGGIPGSQIPNNTYGYGRIDALAAVSELLSGTAVTPTLTAALTQTNRLDLTWPYEATNCSYDVHSSSTAYFPPNASTYQVTLPNGTLQYTTAALDFHLLVAHNCSETSSAQSNQVGQFRYPLVPGS